MTLRPWEVRDAKFCCSIRNDPKLMRWFRQNDVISLQQERRFIEADSVYKGYIVEEGNRPIGVTSLNADNELCIAAPFQYHDSIVKLLLLEHPERGWHGEVFVGNPALKIYLNNGFEITGVKERAYYKKDVGLVDVVNIELPYRNQR